MIAHILCYIAHAYTMLHMRVGYIAFLIYSILLYSTYFTSMLYSTCIYHAMQFESYFKSYFGNVKAFNLKEFKIIAEPVAAMAGGGPAAGVLRRASSLGRA